MSALSNAGVQVAFNAEKLLTEGRFLDNAETAGREYTLECIRADDRHSRCGWTPFEGHEAVFPEWTMVRGTIVYEHDTEEDVFYGNTGKNVRDADGELIG